MSSLDPRSLIAMAVFMSLVMGVVLAFMRHYYPRNIRGLREWACAPLAWALGALLHLVTSAQWLQAPLFLANACVLGGLLLFHLGCRRFLQQPDLKTVLLGIWLAALVSVAWLIWVAPSYPLRLAFVSLTIAALHAWTLALLWRHGPRRFPVRLVQATQALHIAALLVRAVTALARYQDAGLMEPSFMQVLHLGMHVTVVLLLTIGAVLMATDRVHTEFEHMATHDSLTGALNRRAILAKCQEERDRALRQPQSFSLMLLDLDHFKAVNDTHGHQHGDRVLQHFTQSVQAVLRRTDRLGRYGGEEFVALLPGTDAVAAQTLARRIHVALASGHALDCQVSIGLTGWQGVHDTVDAMLARADTQLYRAKAQGRNQTCAG
ncbi:diguanylate cyclase (GGDEF) domain-containing protein [Oryzisolibacter propanilivorax]|uniref:diguanylate cyclase n=1 Tax=Oryzisolibacter propanilivorax TaxID=1527607 RepID=A0A1G9PED6_9BURK|nr:GGDEF domain-containing protein [Oryzisolibacter propanilivorax]SDL97119.1 diguanylate cyclase (GGDEF) domain-containing protein [Oryzisolibacter propanilivorax]